MKKTSIIYFSAILFFLCAFRSNNCNAQINSFNYSIITTSQSGNSQTDSLTIVKYRIVIPDTINISKFHIKLGTLPNQSNLFNDTIVFDGNNHPTGVTYSRNDFVVVITLGAFTPSRYYGEVKLEDWTGNLSNPKSKQY